MPRRCRELRRGDVRGGVAPPLILLVACACTVAWGAPDGAPSLKTFAPGVRIDWAARTVEVDAHVVLREGALELFACSPRSREHESILAVDARPMHIFQAMGLIGLEPGKPVRLDETSDRWLTPTGQRLDLHVRYERGGKPRAFPIDRWLASADAGRPVPRIDWVFAGSRTFDSGRFGADVDGTVICLVDFDTAMIAVGALHSADNDLLWVHANAKEIPPVGTQCTLLIRAAAPRLVVDVMAGGRLHLDGREVTFEAIAGRIERPNGAAAEVRTLELRVDRGVDDAALERLIESLVRAGVPRERIEIRADVLPDSPGD